MSVAAETNFLGKTLVVYVAAMQLRFHKIRNSIKACKFYYVIRAMHCLKLFLQRRVD